MTSHPAVQLSRLREIGWSLWDPIGLRQISGDDWRDGGACADEYDSYLLQIVSRLRRGETHEAVAAYLEEMETDDMGLNRSFNTSERAGATVAAISDYLDPLPPGPVKSS